MSGPNENLPDRSQENPQVPTVPKRPSRQEYEKNVRNAASGNLSALKKQIPTREEYEQKVQAAREKNYQRHVKEDFNTLSQMANGDLKNRLPKGLLNNRKKLNQVLQLLAQANSHKEKGLTGMQFNFDGSFEDNNKIISSLQVLDRVTQNSPSYHIVPTLEQGSVNVYYGTREPKEIRLWGENVAYELFVPQEQKIEVARKKVFEFRKCEDAFREAMYKNVENSLKGILTEKSLSSKLRNELTTPIPQILGSLSRISMHGRGSGYQRLLWHQIHDLDDTYKKTQNSLNDMEKLLKDHPMAPEFFSRIEGARENLRTLYDIAKRTDIHWSAPVIVNKDHYDRVMKSGKNQ